MDEIIRNETGRMVIVRLNSGQTMYMGPNMTSVEIPDSEIMNNSCIEKLRGRGIISLLPVSKKRSSKRPAKKDRVSSMESPGREKSEVTKTKKAVRKITARGDE